MISNIILSRSGFKRDLTWTRFAVRWLVLGFFIHIIAAVSSDGFFRFNEHFQSLELLNQKIGRSSFLDLPLEAHQMIWPWTQASIYSWLVRISNFLGVSDPFNWALNLRLLSSLLGWLSCAALTGCAYVWISNRNWRNWAVILLSLFWLVPFVHARTAPESFAASLFFIGLGVFVLSNSGRDLPRDGGWIAGVLLGLSFDVHFATSIMILGLLFWALIQAKIPLRTLMPVLKGIAAAIVFGVVADRVGYGQWVFTPWNAVKINWISKSGKIFNTLPGLFLLKDLLIGTFPVLGLLTLGAYVLAWVRNPRHLLTYTTFPFFVFLLVFGPEDISAYFPILCCAPVMMILAVYSETTGRFDYEKWISSRAFRNLSLAFLGLNLAALFSLAVSTAWMPVRFYSKLYHFRPFGLNLHYAGPDPYSISNNPVHFYRPPGLLLLPVENYDELLGSMEQTESQIWLFSRQMDLPPAAAKLAKWCQREFSTLPPFLEALSGITFLHVPENWSLYRCQKPVDFRKLQLTDTWKRENKKGHEQTVESVTEPDANPSAEAPPEDSLDSYENSN